MTWWQRLRADLARPEVPVAARERWVLACSAVVIVAVAQLTEPGTTTELALVCVAGLGVAARGWLPRVPSEVFAIVVAVSGALAVRAEGNLEMVFFLAVLMNLYAAWHLGSLTRAVLVAAVCGGAPGLAVMLGNLDISWAPWIAAAAFTVLLGRNVRRQQVLIAELERARQTLAEQAVADERRRIARELHDLAGHTLAAVLLHVNGARHVLRRDLDEAERALIDAEQVGRTSMDQLRATVAALRVSERGTDPAAATAAGIADLADDYRRAGLRVTLQPLQDAAAIDGPVGVALHRICREALTNVARHAPANRVEIVAAITGPAVRLDVVDRGRPPAQADEAGAHFGLVGMRERATALGGTFAAGPTSDGWKVTATIPLPPGAATPIAGATTDDLAERRPVAQPSEPAAR